MPVDKTKAIPDRIKENIAARGIKDPNEGLSTPKFRTIVNVLFQGSHERMHELAFDRNVNLNKDADNSTVSRKKEIELWAIDAYNFAAQKWGEENIAAFIVHLDETNPHAHLTLLPIKDGRFAFKKIFCGQDRYSLSEYWYSIHTEFAEVNKKWGLMRGEKGNNWQKRNIPPREYRLILNRECANLETQIATNKSLIRQLSIEVSHAERRVKGLNTMIANLESKKDDLEKEMMAISANLQAGHGDRDELQKQIDKLSRDYQKILDSLADKQQKLHEATKKLDEYTELAEESRVRASEFRQQAEDYRKEVREASGDLTQQVYFRIKDAIVGDVISELKSILPTLGNAKSAFDSTLLEDLAERGNEIVKCAGYLFAGSVDGAIQFAQSHGGGGSSSDLPWGRKDDEDDILWARRCLFHAAKMMRPRGGRSVKRK